MDPKKVHKESILTVGPRTQPFNSQIENSKIEESVLQPFVVRKAVTNEQTQTETSELQNTDDNLTSSVISAMDKLELLFKQHIDESLANSVTKAINNLEHSMISTIDKLNVKSKQSETLANEITQLKEANAALTEKLYRKEEQLSRLQQQKSEEKKIPNCSNCSTKSEEIKKLVASREKLSKDQHELYLQKELQSIKLLNEIETTKLKVSTKQQQIDLLQKEIKLRDERERTKNEIILKFEDTTKKQAFELLRIQEEFISYKIHDSRDSDSLICLDDVVNPKQEVLPASKQNNREDTQNQLSNSN